MLEPIVDACHFLLNNFPDAQESKLYIASRLTEESQSLFKFGFFPGTFKINVLLNLVQEKDLKQHKLFYSKMIEDAMCPRQVHFSFFENHPLIMPFKDTYGKTVALVGRSLLSEEVRKQQSISKYKNTIFKKGNYLFGLFENKEEILKRDEVIVVEGQIDVIKAMEHNIKNVIALGNSSMSAYQFAVLSRYTNNIKVLLDNDEAGLKGRKLIHKKFHKWANIEDLFISPNYKDLDEYLSNNKNITKFEDIQLI